MAKPEKGYLTAVNDDFTLPPEPPVGKGGTGGGGVYDERMHERVAKLEAALSSLATRADVESVRVEIERGQKENRAWMLATVIALFLGVLAVGNFIASGLRDSAKPAPSPSAQPAPIIIQIPAQAPLPPQPTPAKP